MKRYVFFLLVIWLVDSAVAGPVLPARQHKRAGIEMAHQQTMPCHMQTKLAKAGVMPCCDHGSGQCCHLPVFLLPPQLPAVSVLHEMYTPVRLSLPPQRLSRRHYRPPITA